VTHAFEKLGMTCMGGGDGFDGGARDGAVGASAQDKNPGGRRRGGLRTDAEDQFYGNAEGLFLKARAVELDLVGRMGRSEEHLVTQGGCGDHGAHAASKDKFHAAPGMSLEKADGGPPEDRMPGGGEQHGGGRADAFETDFDEKATE